MKPTFSSLMLELPVPFKQIDGVLHVEAQAHNGITRWLENFDRISLCAPLLPDDANDAAEGAMTWLPVSDLLAGGRLTLHPLPWGYHPAQHFKHQATVVKLFRRLIPAHRYLCFSNLGWLGSWGNIAADEAQRAQRPYAVWLDWVLHEMPDAKPGGLARQAFGRLKLSMLKRNSLRAVRNAALGLFHGNSVHQAYAPFCRQAHIVHDIHLKRGDIIDPARLQRRFARADNILQVGYAGRVHAMKGPLQWIDAVAGAIRSAPSGHRINATWLGDGPLLEAARERVAELGLQDQIHFPGNESNRQKLLGFLRELDVFLFCHLTPESPRCLIEALMSGLPLLGYASPYAQDLVAGCPGGGRFVPLGDAQALAVLLGQQLLAPTQRRQMSQDALRCGEAFSDEAVFRHRSELIKEFLP